MKLTGFTKEQLMQGKDLRELLERFVINIYEGTAPAEAETGVSNSQLLVTITADGNPISGTDTDQITKVTCALASIGDSFTVSINNVNYTYQSVSGDNALKILTALEERLRFSTVVNAMCVPTSSNNGILCLKSKYIGTPFTVTVSATGSSTMSKEDFQSATQNSNYCRYTYDSTTGRLTIPSGTIWRGTGIKNGTATFFRILTPGDDGTQTNSNTVRIQGTVGTFGTDMILTSTTINQGGVITITSSFFTINI
jgi:hypothetical protein